MGRDSGLDFAGGMQVTTKASRTSRAAWRRLRVEVLTRDGWRCRKCGKAGRLEVHHVDHNPRNDALGNLVTWCVSCHVEHHRPKKTPAQAAWDLYLDAFGQG